MKRRGILLCLLLVLSITTASAGQGLYRIYIPLVLSPAMDGIMGIWAYAEPIEETNHCLNPSAEIAGNFAAVGGGTHTRVTTSQFFGVTTYRIQTGANNEGGTYTLLALANAIHFVTMRVRGTLPASWDWSLDNVAYTTPVELLDYDGDWSLYGLQFPAAEANGSTLLYVRQTGAGAGDFNIDGIDVVAATTWTTHVDGDQPGCEWLGSAHASSSRRSALSRAGGLITDFVDLNFEVTGMIGAGMSPITLNVDRYARLPGGELNSQKTQPRTFTLTGVVTGTSLPNLQANREALIEAMAPNRVPEKQPIRIRYSGATTIKEIAAYYQSGLEGVISARFECWEQRFAMRFLAVDPNFYEVGNAADVLDTEDSTTVRYVAARLRSTGQWDPLGPPASGAQVLTIIEGPDKNIYIGGIFDNWDGVPNADRIAVYNTQTGTWGSIGGVAGADGNVHALLFGPTGDLYACGTFANIGGVAAARIARWDGAAWNALGAGYPVNSARGMAFGLDGILYVCGDNLNIRSWNGAAWANVGGAANARQRAIGTAPNGDIYTCGDFITIAAVTMNRISRWDGAAWNALSEGFDNNAHALDFDASGNIYASGAFTASGALTLNRIAFWNGQAWSALSTGFNSTAEEVRVGPDGVVFAAGNFSQAGDITTTDSIAKWTGSSFASMDADFPNPTIVALGLGLPGPIIASNYDVLIGFQLTGTMLYNGSVNITNDGTEDAFPTLKISRSGGASATLISIRNEGLGLELLFDYALLNGETLTIELEPTLKNITSSFFEQQRLDALLQNSDFGTWRLQPGANQVTAFVRVVGGPTVVATVEYRVPHWSAD